MRLAEGDVGDAHGKGIMAHREPEGTDFVAAEFEG
jgi:hypothetical protein